MPLFPLVVTPDGATLDVGIPAPTAYVTATRPDTWTALVDTGATISVISPAVGLALAPPSLGYSPVGHAGGVRTWEPTYSSGADVAAGTTHALEDHPASEDGFTPTRTTIHFAIPGSIFHRDSTAAYRAPVTRPPDRQVPPRASSNSAIAPSQRSRVHEPSRARTIGNGSPR
jgi:hypothetical protein